MARQLAIAKQDRLERLTKSIVDGHEAIIGLAKTVQQKSREALAEAILVGEALTEAKGIIGHGHFTQYCVISIPFSHDTANRYMAISKANRAGRLVGVNGLHEAYRLLKGLNDDDRPQRLITPPSAVETPATPPEPPIEPEVLPAEEVQPEPGEVIDAEVVPGEPPITEGAQDPPEINAHFNRLPGLVQDVMAYAKSQVEQGRLTIEQVEEACKPLTQWLEAKATEDALAF